MSNRNHTPTAQQLAALESFKRRIAEHNYLIAPVAQTYRRHESDFVAIPKTAPRQFVVVRIAPTCIVVRPFGENSHHIATVLADMRVRLPKSARKGMPRLRYAGDCETPWRDYADPSAHEELALLLN